MLSPFNPFPNLLDFSLFAPLIIRLFLGGFFIFLGYVTLRGNKHQRVFHVPYYASWISFLGGLFVFLGFKTQYAGIALAGLCIFLLFFNKKLDTQQFEYRAVYLLLLAMSLSLLFSGAGRLAFDLPL